MELILVPLIFILLCFAGLVLTGPGECYFCGHRLDRKKRPIYVKKKRACENCSIYEDKKG